jgi:hypothetical protein
MAVVLVIALLPGIALCATTAAPVPAASTAAAPPALPDALTEEAARDLVARLSDEQVRSLLLEQLGRAAAGRNASAGRAPGPMGMAGVVGEHAASMRDR